MGNDHLLKIEDLSVVYKTEDAMVQAISDLSIAIDESETLGFVGETGAGKTTMALTIMGLLPKYVGFVKQGEIFFEGVNLLNKTPKQMRKIRGEKIAMIFQDPMTSLDPVIKVVDQVVEMIQLHSSFNKAQARQKAIEILGKVGIKEDRVEAYPHEFSGGMKQRVVIAIALACAPKLIIADEPTTALDVTIQAQVLDLMKKLKREMGMSMILITHDLGVVGEICDTVAIMYFGNIVEYGKKEEVYANPKHPYTLGLFNSIPDIEDDNIMRLNEIKGFPPDPTAPIKGCPFNTRCAKAMAKCCETMPQNTNFSSTHYVKCFLYEGETNDEQR